MYRGPDVIKVWRNVVAGKKQNNNNNNNNICHKWFFSVFYGKIFILFYFEETDTYTKYKYQITKQVNILITNMTNNKKYSNYNITLIIMCDCCCWELHCSHAKMLFSVSNFIWYLLIKMATDHIERQFAKVWKLLIDWFIQSLKCELKTDFTVSLRSHLLVNQDLTVSPDEIL